MRKATILGWYGYRNFGDDEVILQGLRRLLAGWDVSVMSSTPASKYPLFNYDEINKSDLFVVGGGELIHKDRLFFYSPLVKHSFIPAVAHRLLTFTSWAKKIKIPKIILGCGVNASSASDLKPLVIKELEQFNYIGVRDKSSFEVLSSFPQLKNKVELFFDLAYALNGNYKQQQKTNYAVVVPTDRSLLNTVEASKKWLTKKLKPYDKAVFVPFGQVDNNDYATCKALASCANTAEVLTPNGLTFDDVASLFAGASMAFPYRLHGLILAHMFGVKYNYWPYHPKLHRVYETVQYLDPKEIQSIQRTRFDNALVKGGIA